MTFPSSPVIHFYYRADHQHTCSGCPDPAGKTGSQQKKSHIDSGGTGQIPFHCNVSGHTEQSEQQYNKGQIITHQTFQHRFQRHPGSIHDCKGNYKQKRPECNCMNLVLFPPLRSDQRKNCNTQQKSCKGNAQSQRNHPCSFTSCFCCQNLQRRSGAKYGCASQKQKNFLYKCLHHPVFLLPLIYSSRKQLSFLLSPAAAHFTKTHYSTL